MARSKIIFSCLLCLTTIGSESSAQNADLQTSTPINNQGALEESMATSWVVSDVPAGDNLSFWDLSITPLSTAKILLGSSSEFLFAAVLDGEVEVEESVLGPGQMAVWQHLGGDALIVYFDADLLQSNFRALERQDLADELQPVADWQSTLKFWGILQPTDVSVAMPVLPRVERLRRQYLNSPVVISTRRTGDPVSAQADLVAERFALALENSDPDQVGALLDPRLFATGGNLAVDPDWPDRRRTFAQHLVGSAVSSVTAPESGPADATYQLTIDGVPYTMSLSYFDEAVFVTSIEVLE